MNGTQLLTGPLAQAIGWALLHLLWQATIVAGILAAVLALIPRQSANARYSAACGALGLVFALFIATAWKTYDPAVAPVTAPLTESQAMKITVTNVPVALATIAAETWRERMLSMVASARQSLPMVVAVWLFGVVFLSSRLLLTWMRARRLAQAGQPANIQWQRAARRLSNALGLRRAVRLLESAAVEVPSVIGMLRPVILLPASTLTGLTPAQIEMVLAHELAHIRRHDFLVNLLQAVVETLMFYHPAVWWMSRRVRIERENCCDDMAVAVCGNPIQYAKALTRLEELRSAPGLVVAANGGSLLDRIRRIAGGRAESNAISARWAAAMITLVVLAVGAGIPSLPAFAQREQKAAEPSKAKVDVTAPIEPEETEEADADDSDVKAAAAAEAYVDDADDADDDEDYDAVPAIAPIARAAALAAVDSVRAAPTPMPAPMVAGVRAPRVPHAPRLAFAGDLDFDYDDDNDDDEEKSAKKIGSERLTVDELISLRASGVTPDYIDAMRGIFGELTVREVSGLKALGVSAEYVRQMRTAGVDVKTAREAQSLKATGVTVKFVQQLAAAGYSNLTPKELSRMAAVGVDEDFIREMSKYKKN